MSKIGSTVQRHPIATVLGTSLAASSIWAAKAMLKGPGVINATTSQVPGQITPSQVVINNAPQPPAVVADNTPQPLAVVADNAPQPPAVVAKNAPQSRKSGISYSRRLLEELRQYEEMVEENDGDNIYALDYDEEDITTIHAVLKGPVDSLYRWKFVRLIMKFPSTYPYEPPKVTFVQRFGRRFHPNLYTDGKVCLSILNTWAGPTWQPTLNIDAILRTIQSILDNQPYIHEPNRADDVTYNKFVEYHTWETMLLHLIQMEERPRLHAFMLDSTLERVSSIKRYLKTKAQEEPSPVQLHVAPYMIGTQTVDWKRLAAEMNTFLEDYE